MNFELTPDPYWEEGQLIGPEHFDRLTNFLHHCNRWKSDLHPFPWGVYLLEIKILKDYVDIRDFAIVFPNGQIFTNTSAYLEGKYTLPDLESSPEHIQLCLVLEEPSSGKMIEGVCCKNWKLSCIPQDKIKNNQEYIPIARVQKVKKTPTDFGWDLDNTYIPPTFKVRGNTYLQQNLQNIVDKIICSLQ
jgi:predicted component of type VI protein secretion system